MSQQMCRNLGEKKTFRFSFNGDLSSKFTNLNEARASLPLSRLRLSGLFARGVLQQRCVAFFGGQLDVPHHGAANEAVLDGQHVRIFLGIRHGNVRQFDVEILVHRMKSSMNGQVVLQLDHHVLAHEGLQGGQERKQLKHQPVHIQVHNQFTLCISQTLHKCMPRSAL